MHHDAVVKSTGERWQVFRTGHVNHIMNGCDRGAWSDQGQKEMRGVQQINFVTGENSWQLELLAKRIVLEAGAKFPCVRRMNHALTLRRENEQILVFWRLGDDGFGQALHVPADARVADSPQVKSNLHAEP